ncbi:MAG TPA: peptidyl-prolyl cis-trans isomerase [Terriglobales bacterium]|nr:peptidyl-prolyl cis-trans isomerase [Terriglobales bacterium]
MRIGYFSILLLASLAMGQAAPSSTTPPAENAGPAASAGANKSTEAEVAPDTPVITVPGVCHPPGGHSKTAAANSKDDCRTVITRAQFEALANALQPNMNAQTKRRLADVYPRLLVMAQEARKRGLEDKPSYKEVVQFNRLQILSQELGRTLKEEADNVPAADIDKYYKDNPEAFEQAALLRIYVPKDKQEASSKADVEGKEETAEDTAKDSEKEKASEEAMKKVADDLHKRAAAGEDFDKLQKEAYTSAGIQGAPAPTNIGKMTRGQIPVNQRSVFDLKAGEVSQLFTEPNGYYIYKVVSKETKPLDQARDEIRTTLSQQRLQDSMSKYQQENKATLNETYFGPAGPPQMPPRMGAGGPPMPPGGRPQAPAAPTAGTAKPAPPQAPQQ